MDTQAPPQWLGPVLIDAIAPNGHNPNQMTVAEFEGLKKNIETFGFRDPILVRPAATQSTGSPVRYEIVDGEHRWQACKDLGLPTIPCYLQPLTDATAKLSTLSQNLIHGTHDLVAQANLIVDIQRDIAPSDIMALLGVRPVEFGEMLAILDAPVPAPVTTQEDEPPVNITLTLLRNEYLAFEEALERAMGAAPDVDTVILVQDQVAQYDAAMQRAIKLLNIQKRGVAFARICQAFLTLDDEALRTLHDEKSTD